MSGYYDNTNRGGLWKNDRKEKESQPDYTGNINVAGREFRLSAWIKTAKDGKKFMSLSVKPKEEKSELAPKGEPDFVQRRGVMDDEIPF